MVTLTSILEILALKEALSMTQLANAVGCTIRELESAMEQLKHMGYIDRDIFGQSCSNSSCGSDQCEGCGFATSESLAVWVLTERGQTIVDSGPQ